ncbi:MAG: class I SAM-dependent DNA methyltransferase [Azospirillaceae bacterium]
MPPAADPDSISAFIDRWTASGGAEMANFQSFAKELCALLGLPQPDPAQERNAANDYVFERRVEFKHDNGTTSQGRIDLYRRDCFILEAKQSANRVRLGGDLDQLALLPEDARQIKRGTAVRGTRGLDQAMFEARRQAEGYARALPVEHGYPPFILVVDVGRVIEVYADFSGQGKNYAHFPDRQSYRLSLDDLRDGEIQERLRSIWLDPRALDPTRTSAEVTTDIAVRLARVARTLEGKRDAGEVAEFLMRCLFTMFAEDVGLLPEGKFAELLAEMEKTPAHFAPALESLWTVMDEGGYSPHFNAIIRHFNGTLFKTRTAIPLDAEEIRELRIAASKDWRHVEPSIFGTLLERALDPRERARLGAHYTPRAYVERLIVPTIMEPLRDEWDAVKVAARDLVKHGDEEGALGAIQDFHHRLCTTIVLDPACGTGNFLYVALELMKKLEGEVMEALEDLGLDQARQAMTGETVSPEQFRGLEINPRAVAIADLVLWIGYLKWQLKTGGATAVNDPVLRATGTIEEEDAILSYRERRLITDAQGRPVTIWDGRTYQAHPITGEAVPDETARIETYRYADPRAATWPEAHFIVGNPPFIGGKDMRAELGDGYAEAAWAARPDMPGGADFVMHFWDQAARILTQPRPKEIGKGARIERREPVRLRRFGFITTNSITQTFSRRVIERHMSGRVPLSLVFAVPDHPWQKAAGKAAVRIAMTVAERGTGEGVLAKVAHEADLASDTPTVLLEKRRGMVRANLTLGANTSAARALLANEMVCSPGVKLHGAGFIVTLERARELGLGAVPGLENHILAYRNGRDIADRPRGVMVIDLYPLTAEQVRDRFPAVYQHVADHVKPERDHNKRASYRDNWWIFGEPRREFRPALEGLTRYITTIETAKHRFFQFLDASIRPDNMLVNIGLDTTAHLSLLSSRVHTHWALAAGGWLGVGNDARYSKTRTFDPFPFPDLASLTPALSERLRDLGERLDSFRKERLAAHGFLTMTGLYNVLERRRAVLHAPDAPPLDDRERAIDEAGQVGVLMDLHDAIDRAVLGAYGWSDLADALVGRPGATTPSPHKSAEQAAAEEDLLGRLVALNQVRQVEEARGQVRWLRPDFQAPRLAHKVSVPEGEQVEADIAPLPADERLPWPEDGLDQIRAVRALLSRAGSPAGEPEILAAFTGRASPKRKARVAAVLESLVEMGIARMDDSGGGFFAAR